MAFSTGPDLQYVFDAFYVNVPGSQLVTYNNPMADFADGSSRNLPNPWLGPDVRGELANMKDNILHAIDQCPAGQDDAIVVFYTGHGAYDDNGHFLVMPDGQTLLYRKTILEKLAGKHPRLAVLITDSCNVPVPSEMQPGPAAMLLPPERISPLFESLFIRSRGVVDMNSSSEGEFSVGAIGGGLLTLSLAYMGNQPDFKAYRGFTRPQRSPSDVPNNAVIPSIDHSAAMERFFGTLNEHGMHGNFDPDKPPFGVFFAHREQGLNWETVGQLLTTKVDTLFKTMNPDGWDTSRGKQRTQTVRIYSLAAGRGIPQAIAPEQTPPQTEQQGHWGQPVWRPEVGDRIVEVNGRTIHRQADYVQAVKNSPTTMVFRLWDAKTGKTFLMRTQLNPQGADSRFGVGAENAAEGGVRVTYVMPGYPGTRCQVWE